MTTVASHGDLSPVPPRRALLGLVAVIFGAFISTLTGRLSSFGLADIRGAIHVGYDEGAWITTSMTTAQMLVTPLTIWAGTVYGPRKVLIWGASLFAAASAAIPFSTTIAEFLTFQFLAGMGSGTFIPLTLSVVLRTLPARFWAYGIVVYALNLELSLNISASLEAWYIDNLSWRFIFWQSVPLALGMIACLYFGMPAQPKPKAVKRPALFGVMTAGMGLALIYAALDQGNRLNWLDSGTIVGLLSAGSILLGAAVINLLLVPSDWFDLRGAFRWPLPLLLLMVIVLRLTILSTAFLIPQFLISVRGYRSLEIGQALIWIAIPQLIAAPIAALLLRRVDSRWTACAGLVAVSVACWIVSHSMTSSWGPEQFLATQLLQAVGQTLALSGIVFTSVLRMRADTQATFGAMIQSARLLGGEVGLAFTVTFVRMREQHASNVIGQDVVTGDHDVMSRLQRYANFLAPRSGAETEPRSVSLLAGTVRQAADVQSCIDGFLAIGSVSMLALVVLFILRPVPSGPATYRPFTFRFRRLR